MTYTVADSAEPLCSTPSFWTDFVSPTSIFIVDPAWAFSTSCFLSFSSTVTLLATADSAFDTSLGFFTRRLNEEGSLRFGSLIFLPESPESQPEPAMSVHLPA